MIHFVVALPAEARPLIRHFKLGHRQTDSAFPIYRNADMALVVSGPGKTAAAAATAILQDYAATNEPVAWLNVGIAGHASHAIGTGLIPDRITDKATGRTWQLPCIADMDVPTGSLQTVDTPETDYRDDTLYDMEAAGFYPAARRFSGAALVKCFKVISDNRAQTTATVTAKLCEQLLAGQLGSIDKLAAVLNNMASGCNSWRAPHAEIRSPGRRPPDDE